MAPEARQCIFIFHSVSQFRFAMQGARQLGLTARTPFSQCEVLLSNDALHLRGGARVRQREPPPRGLAALGDLLVRFTDLLNENQSTSSDRCLSGTPSADLIGGAVVPAPA